jgi:hypothetical protein
MSSGSDLDPRARAASSAERTENVRVAAQVALLHVGVGTPYLSSRAAPSIRCGLLQADVGLAHDLHEPNAAAVPVHERLGRGDVVVGRVVQELSGVLLEVDAYEADGLRPRGRFDLD